MFLTVCYPILSHKPTSKHSVDLELNLPPRTHKFAETKATPSCSLSRHQSIAYSRKKPAATAAANPRAGGWGKVKKLAQEKKLAAAKKKEEDQQSLITTGEKSTPVEPRPTKHVSKAVARENQRRIRQIRKRKRAEFESAFMVDSQVYSKILLQQQDEFDEKRFGLRFKDYIDGVSSEGKKGRIKTNS